MTLTWGINITLQDNLHAWQRPEASTLVHILNPGPFSQAHVLHGSPCEHWDLGTHLSYMVHPTIKYQLGKNHGHSIIIESQAVRLKLKAFPYTPWAHPDLIPDTG